ncbi:MAG: YceI family protein, partial [Caulobacterales bacterium]|nr:YceI family protein [Caulobacterales bacterium]
RTRPPAPGLSTRFAAAAFAAPLAVFIAIAWIGRAPSSAEAASADVTPATAGAAASGGWVVDHAASRLAFAGVNSGQPFEGVFESWTAEITFDPGDLDAARVLVRVATGTAATGSSYNDSTLKQGDWFDVGANPDAVFESGAIRAAADGGYEAAGFLTLKGETTPLDLPFTVDIDGDVATAAGQAIIDRTSVGIGIQSDAGGDWVGKDVTVTFDITANRAE